MVFEYDRDAEQVAKSEAKRRQWRRAFHFVVAGLVLSAVILAVIRYQNKAHSSSTEAHQPIIGVQKSEFNGLAERLEVLESDYKALADAVSLNRGDINAMPTEGDIVELRAMINDLTIEQPAKSEPVAVDLTGFVRDESIPLVDQINNPAAMVHGPRAKRYGAAEYYQTPDGHKYAIFVDKPHGIASVIDLISAFDGKSIGTYIQGGEGVPGYKSFTGGDAKLAAFYLDVMSDRGLKPEFTIDIRDLAMVHAIVNTHAHAEGSDYLINNQEFDEAFALYELSKQ